MIAGFLLITLAIVLIPSSFSLETEVRSVTITSKELSYEQKEPGSWKVEKSAEWTSKGKARITFDVDTVLKTSSLNKDVILVLDVSGSMAGEKLDRVKHDSKELVNSLLSDSNNRVALITFETESTLVSKLTNEKETILNQIDAITELGTTNYYQALINVDEILKDYQKEENRECIVLFLTDGYPNEDIPNQIAEYSYLKKQYSYLTINGIQYEMGKSILEPIQEISDHQFIADMESLNNVLFQASILPITYSNFTIADYLNANYFEIESIEDIQVSQGEVSLIEENGVPKVTWNIPYFKSGSSAQMTIDVKLKEEYLEKSGYYPTNQKEEIESEIEEVEERVESKETPILKTPNEIVYESNAPEGCQVKNVPANERKWAKEIVEISEEEPSCEGYQFRGWNIITEGVKRVNDDYFEMPGKDVVLRAEWGKVGLSKTMDGEVYVAPPPVMQKVGTPSYTDKLWKYKSEITKIIFQNTINPIGTESWDISAANNGTVMAYYDKENTTVYIQANGNIIANEDSFYLFYDFSNLKEIEGLDLLDTSQVINMSYMFDKCSQLTNLDLNNWDTSSVKYMSYMFDKCSQLANLDLSGWDTSSVMNMNNMFQDCSHLTSVGDLSEWNTSSVKYMNAMFQSCSNLTDLDFIKDWDTSSVMNMQSMFSGCSQLTSLDSIKDWETSSVTDMGSMFSGCSNLTTLDLSGWDTFSVTYMVSMFSNCSQLTDLDLSGWDTSSVNNMSNMFYNCSQLTNLDSIKEWDTSSVTYMYQMFLGCSQLTDLDLSSWDTSSVTYMDSMFYNCKNLTTTINIAILPSKINDYSSMFYSAATADGAQITVNYTIENESLVDQMIETKSDGSHVDKGTPINSHTVIVNGNEDIVASTKASQYYPNVRVTLTSVSGRKIVSFMMNDQTITGNTFKMPDSDVTITNVVYAE